MNPPRRMSSIMNWPVGFVARIHLGAISGLTSGEAAGRIRRANRQTSSSRSEFFRFEALITALVGITAACYLLEVMLARPDWSVVAYHTIVPSLGSRESVLLAVGVIGTTVMPHAIYLHSDLTKDRVVPRSPMQARQLVVWSNREIVLALSLAGLVNMAMMSMAAAVFHEAGRSDVATIETAYHTLTPLLGSAAAAAFLIALLDDRFHESGRV